MMIVLMRISLQNVEVLQVEVQARMTKGEKAEEKFFRIFETAKRSRRRESTRNTKD